MAILAAGTANPGSSDPRTLEQNKTLDSLANNDGIIQSSYRGMFLLPDGTLTRDFTILNIPPARKAEIEAVIAAGTDPNRPSGGYILILNMDGIPIQYFGVGQPLEVEVLPTPTPIPPTPTLPPTPIPVPVTPVNVLNYLRFTPSIESIFTKQYVLKSLNNIESEVITIENISTNISINIRFESLHASVIVPESFDLHPSQTKSVVIKFSKDMIERTVPFEGKFSSKFNIHVRDIYNV